jgi:probable rRNA maturation factor
MQIRSYCVDIEIEAFCPFPKPYTKVIEAAVLSTIENVPVSRLGRYLGKKKNNLLSVCLVSEKTIQTLNKKYRGKNKVTDVLSFPSDLKFSDVPFRKTGDIAICWSRAKKQRAEFGTSEKGELKRLVVHGLLHLLGYDHEKSARAEARMVALEKKSLRWLPT